MNCWEGCIAKFIHPGPSYGAWLLCLRVDPDLESDAPNDVWWRIELLCVTPVHDGCRDIFVQGLPGSKGWAQDKYMQPLKPDELKDEDEVTREIPNDYIMS